MGNMVFCVSASIIFFAFNQILEIKLVFWVVPKIKQGCYFLNYSCIPPNDTLRY
jgi:hypothetical protein